MVFSWRRPYWRVSMDTVVMIVFGRFVIFVDVLDIIESFVCDSLVECLGGMYLFAICNCCDVESWILIICRSINKWKTYATFFVSQASECYLLWYNELCMILIWYNWYMVRLALSRFSFLSVILFFPVLQFLICFSMLDVATMHHSSKYYIKYYCVHATTFNVLLLLPFSSSAMVLYVYLFFSVFIVAEQK